MRYGFLSLLGITTALAIGCGACAGGGPRGDGAPRSTATHVQLVRVIDGDTIVVRDHQGEYKVRLAGIDAPERNQPHGKAASKILSEALARRDIHIASNGRRDRYGRVLSEVYAGRSWVNLLLVESGAAWVPPAPTTGNHPVLLHAEQQARNAAIGLWKEGAPVPPWSWRKRQR